MDKQEKRLLESIDVGIDAGMVQTQQTAERVVGAIEALKPREQKVAELQERAAATMRRLGIEPTVERPPLGLPAFQSYWRDLLAAMVHGDREAMARLERDRRDPEARAGKHYRAISTTPGAGGEFAKVTGPPNFIVDAFASGVATENVLASLLPRWPMPEHGIHVSTPQITTPSAAGSVAEGSPVTNTDPVTALIDTPKATIAGRVPVSDQLLDLGGMATEFFIATELGASNAAEFERQIAVGSGTNEMTGLLNTAGILTQVYTDATPTTAEWIVPLTQLISTMAQQRKRLPDAIVVSARRWAFLVGGEDASSRPIFASVVPPIRSNGSTVGLVGSVGGIACYATQGIPSNLGAGTNEDRPLVLYTPDLVLLQSPVEIIATDQHGTTLQEQVIAYCYAALIVKHASAIGTLTGTGCILPSGY